MNPPVFNGVENYRYMLMEDHLFWKSMGVTFAYVFLTIPLKLAFALGIAFVGRDSDLVLLYPLPFWMIDGKD
jgi:oligogalacturonide transport system permease protein